VRQLDLLHRLLCLSWLLCHFDIRDPEDRLRVDSLTCRFPLELKWLLGIAPPKVLQIYNVVAHLNICYAVLKFCCR
jgi:hypothetical protein